MRGRRQPSYPSDPAARAKWLLQNDRELLKELNALGLTDEQKRAAFGNDKSRSPAASVKTYIKLLNQKKKPSAAALKEANTPRHKSVHHTIDGRKKQIFGPDGRTTLSPQEVRAYEDAGYVIAEIDSHGQNDAALSKMVTPEEKERLRRNGSLSGSKESIPESIQVGEQQLADARRWQEQKFLTDEQKAVLADRFNNVTKYREDFGAGIYGSGLSPVKRQHDLYNKFLNKLAIDGEITPDELIAYLREVGHRGHVGIPGWAWAMNDRRNVVSQSAYLNGELGRTQTTPEFLDANRHISLGQNFALSGEDLGFLREQQEKYPNLFPRGLLETPQSLIAEPFIRDPVRLGNNPANFLFGRQGGYELKKGVTPSRSERRALGGLLVSVPNFDHRTHQAILGNQFLNEQEMLKLEAIDSEIKSNLVSKAEEVSKQIRKSGENISAIEHVSRALKMMPEDQAKQLGKVDPRILALTAGLGAVTLPLMSEEGREKAVEKGVNALSWLGEKYETGENLMQENNPVYAFFSDNFDKGVSLANSLTPNVGVTQQMPESFGEDGMSYGGGTHTSKYGVGDVSKSVWDTFIAPLTFDALKVGAGVLEPEFSTVENGGGGF